MNAKQWFWTCHRCGWSGNTNENDKCHDCGAAIRCDVAGGHYDFDGDGMCDRGCGYSFHTCTTDITKRHPNY
jgi:hypothetical protein